MKFKQFIMALVCFALLALLLCIVYARATWDGEALPAPAPVVPVEETVEPEQP